MGPADIVLRVAPEGDEGTYRFECPGCSVPVEKEADQKVIALLVSAGVDVVSEPHPEPSRAAFTVDDLIQFHLDLQQDDYLLRLLADG